MKIKSFLITVVFITAVLCFSVFIKVDAADNSAQISQLQAQIASLQAQAQALQAQQGTTETAWCHTFNTNLGYADSGKDEVGYLHTALDKEGIAYGGDTGNAYTKATGDAVVKFQAKYGISQTGYVGAQTRTKLNALYGCASSISTSSAVAAATAKSTTPDSSTSSASASPAALDSKTITYDDTVFENNTLTYTDANLYTVTPTDFKSMYPYDAGFWCHTFNKNLTRDDSGSYEAGELHIALERENINCGIGATTAYDGGVATAVMKFQAKYGISQTGTVGPQTRAKLNALYGCPDASSVSLTPEPSPFYTKTYDEWLFLSADEKNALSKSYINVFSPVTTLNYNYNTFFDTEGSFNLSGVCEGRADQYLRVPYKNKYGYWGEYDFFCPYGCREHIFAGHETATCYDYDQILSKATFGPWQEVRTMDPTSNNIIWGDITEAAVVNEIHKKTVDYPSMFFGYTSGRGPTKGNQAYTWFDYGPTTAYGSRVTSRQMYGIDIPRLFDFKYPIAGDWDAAGFYYAEVPQLAPGTYHVRFTVSNVFSTISGKDVVYTIPEHSTTSTNQCKSIPKWLCTNWGLPLKKTATQYWGGMDYRRCMAPYNITRSDSDMNYCTDTSCTYCIANRPEEHKDLACTPNWSCDDWSVCTNNVGGARTCVESDSTGTKCTSNSGTSYRTCKDLNGCIDVPLQFKPVEQIPCDGAGFCDWKCTGWSSCGGGQQTRTCSESTGFFGCKSPATSKSCEEVCTSKWSCTDWSTCIDDKHERACSDENNCGTATGKPVEKEVCCAPNWDCGAWSDCNYTNNQKTRICKDLNKCNTVVSKPPEASSCDTSHCTSKWICGDWLKCKAGKQERHCYDFFNCNGQAYGSPSTSQSCACVPEWTCADWGGCDGEKQTRACGDANECGIEPDSSVTTRSCNCTPNISCANWTACNSSGWQTRTCVDKNSCSVSGVDLSTSQKCTSACTPNWTCASWGVCQRGVDGIYQKTRTCADSNKCGTDVAYSGYTTSETCTPPATTTGCVTNWTCGAWSACTDSAKIRTCTDSNNCGTTDNKPATMQSCSEDKAVTITYPNGGETLIQGQAYTIKWDVRSYTDVKLYLSKDGTVVSTISDTTPNSGSYTWTVPSAIFGSGFQIIIAGPGSSAMLVLDVSDGNFAIVSSSTSVCTPSWYCGSWTTCSGSSQNRTCTDLNNCGVATDKPAIAQTCGCIPSWTCGSWTTCSGNLQTRTCADSKNCETTTDKPVTTQSCTPVCNVNWVCGTWSACSGNSQNRLCVDINNCGVATDKPPITQGCSNTCTPNWSCSDWGECTHSGQSRTCTDLNKCNIGVGPSLKQECVKSSVRLNFEMLFPVGGETLIQGRTYTLRWTSNGTEPMTIRLIDGKTDPYLIKTPEERVVLTVAADIPNSGSYDWTVPTSLSPGPEFQLFVTSKPDANLNRYGLIGFHFTIAASSSSPLDECNYDNWTYTLSPVVCPSTGVQTKTWTQVGAACSGGVSHPATEAVTCAYQAPACKESDWTYTLSPTVCPSSGSQTKIWTKIGACSGGVAYLPTQLVSCSYQTPTCASFTYSGWTACSSSGVRTRTIIGSFPSGCAGGSPVTSEACSYVPPCTESNWTYDLSPLTCPSNSQQSKLWTLIGTCTGGVTHPSLETVSCAYLAPITTPTCASFTFSAWSTCTSSGIQTRTVTSSSPSGCAGGSPITSQSCAYTAPASTCTSFTYSAWSDCSSMGIQTRTVTSSSPSGCAGGSLVTSQSCAYIPSCADSDWTYALSPTTCTSTGIQTKTWKRVGTCSGGVTHPASENISCAYSAPSITVTSPNGGESWRVGETRNITWTSTGLPSDAQVTLLFVNYDGASASITSSISASSGKYSWTIPERIAYYNAGTVGSRLNIRVYVNSSIGQFFDDSDNYFAITAPTALNNSQDSLASISVAIQKIAEQLKALLGN